MRSHLPVHKDNKQPFFRSVPPNSSGGYQYSQKSRRGGNYSGRGYRRPSGTNELVNTYSCSKLFDNRFQKYIAKSSSMSGYNPPPPPPPKLVSYPPAGRLVHYQQNWSKVTQDQWVLNTIQSYLIDFSSMPYQPVIPHCPQYSAEQTHLISEEVTELPQKGAIGEIVPVKQPEFYSNLFLIPNKDGGQRPVINLKALTL